VSFDAPGESWTVIHGLIDGLIGFEGIVAAFLRVSLFVVLLVGMFQSTLSGSTRKLSGNNSLFLGPYG